MQQQILSILQKYGTTLSPELLDQADAELQALGVRQQRNSAGQARGRLFLPSGETVDLGDFGGPFQWVSRGFDATGDGAGGSTSGTGGGATTAGGTDQFPNGNLADFNPGGGGLQNLADFQGGVPGQGSIEDFLKATPGYQFAFDQGMQGIQRSAAAKGTLLTGGTLKQLAQYGTGLADQTYGNTVNRYLSLADIGARTATSAF